MSGLFDMMVGSSTGSIVAAGLSIRKNISTNEEEPKFWAPDLLEIYNDEQLFGNKNHIREWAYSIVPFCVLLLFLYPLFKLS